MCFTFDLVHIHTIELKSSFHEMFILFHACALIFYSVLKYLKILVVVH